MKYFVINKQFYPWFLFFSHCPNTSSDNDQWDWSGALIGKYRTGWAGQCNGGFLKWNRIHWIQRIQRIHWTMNSVQYKDLLGYLWLCGTVVESLSLTQEIVGSNTAIFLKLYFLSLNSVKTFRENSNRFHTRAHRLMDLLDYLCIEHFRVNLSM